MLNLVELPVELILAILGHLPLKDVVRSCAVCRVLSNLIKGSLNLQYFINLNRFGLSDNPYSSVPISDKLSRLREREVGWRNLEWSSQSTIILDHPDLGEGNNDELVPQYTSRSGRIVVSMWHAASWTLRSVSQVEIGYVVPSEGDLGEDNAVPQPFGVKTLEFADMVITEWEMAPELNLMVLVEHKDNPNFEVENTFVIHIRALDTGLAHPLAARSTLEPPVALDGPLIVQFPLYIHNHHVAIIAYPVELQNDFPFFKIVYIWDWTTGVLVAMTHFSTVFESPALLFLTDNTYLITCTSEAPQSTSGDAHLDVFTWVTSPDGEPIKPDMVASYQIPVSKSKIDQLSVECSRTGSVKFSLPPRFTHHHHNHHHSANSNTAADATLKKESKRLFHNASDAELVTIKIQGYGADSAYNIFVHRKTFLSFLSLPPSPKFMSLSGRASKGGTKVLPWSEWGPSQTRWFKRDDDATALNDLRMEGLDDMTLEAYYERTYISHPVLSGQRIIASRPLESDWRGLPDGRGDGKPIKMLDFNPYALPSTSSIPTSYRRREEKEVSRDEPTILEDRNMFTIRSVESRLPYVEVSTNERYIFENVIVDDDRIILVPGEDGKRLFRILGV